MPNPDDFQYAMEASKVLHEPARRIDTFGSTRFEFEVLSEPMDSVGSVRVRRGEVQAQKPQLIKPEGFSDIELEGFNPQMLEVIEHLKQNGVDLSFLRYGFQFKRSEVAEEIVHDHMESVKKKALENVRRTGNPSLVVIEAIDDSWEVGVMKFTIDMIMKSSEINRFDFKRRGLM
ncbi:hypothetical protein N9Z85_05320 [Akkermansiaceae bacterium]|jgi:hypothetical protein|nr:hypothetical protein [Akkermansiaceae bacterium]MDB4519026.1 hypothetical protein [Akkermansiaceae bacterium]|tara:strand:- start:3284 stop:3808 length:525 start_codon:yes stop_codon:yes gene_type:complete